MLLFIVCSLLSVPMQNSADAPSNYQPLSDLSLRTQYEDCLQ